MGNNPSVRQFKTDMLDLVNKAKYNFHEEMLAQADELVGNIQNAIQHSVSGNLKKSVRKKDVSQLDAGGGKISVLVLAGGPLTRKHEKSGSHDYSVDVEFGDKVRPAEPFFYNTARLYQQAGLEQFKETLEETIEENNKVRGLRSDNYTNRQATVSVGGRGGAVVIQKGKR